MTPLPSPHLTHCQLIHYRKPDLSGSSVGTFIILVYDLHAGSADVQSKGIPFRLINDSITSFTRVEFSQLAADYKTVNLGQGFPDFSPPKFVQDAFCKAICGGPAMHQYTRAFVSRGIVF